MSINSHSPFPPPDISRSREVHMTMNQGNATRTCSRNAFATCDGDADRADPEQSATHDAFAHILSGVRGDHGRSVRSNGATASLLADGGTIGACDRIPLDRCLFRTGEQLAAMVAAGEFEDSPHYVGDQINSLAIHLLDASEIAAGLIQDRLPKPWVTLVSLTAACSSLVFAGAQAAGYGEWRLGVAEMVAGAAALVCASLVRA